ncbi:MAG TPA: hypothetical protein EYP57_04090, partial [Thermodesulfobacteriaceae bacterium]|nr:hypothetical protein [Thermodesulfobacteriaceae bacterium]
ANSYEDDCYKSENQFDFVMANPPFNVKGIKESTVKNDARFTHYGLPKAKGKKDDKITDANYLWISLFATSLNDKGRAGFVMPNSASDARNSEYEIRKKVVDSGIVDCMVSIPSNMFYTVTLPATLWFFIQIQGRIGQQSSVQAGDPFGCQVSIEKIIHIPGIYAFFGQEPGDVRFQFSVTA